MTTAKKPPATPEQIIAAVQKAANATQKKNATQFAQAFIARTHSSELQAHSAQEWAAISNDLLAYAGNRKRGKVNLRVLAPSEKANGWTSNRMALQIVNDDMPFLVDSITNALSERGIGVHGLLHPVVSVARDKTGKLEALSGGSLESLMHIEIDRLDADDARALEKYLLEVLADVRASVDDWAKMRDRMLAAAKGLEEKAGVVDPETIAESQEFLRWAADNHFTYLGYREYAVVKQGKEQMLVAVDGSGLGILRDEDESTPRLLKSMDAHALQKHGVREPLIITKTNARSNVHRRGYMDYIGVVTFDAKGNATGERRFVGLFTSSAYNRRPWEIPMVRTRFEKVMADSKLPDAGHSAKALRHVLETLPRDELFQSSAEELGSLGEGIIGLQERVESKIFLRRDRYGRFFSALVYVPRDRFNTEVRLRIEQLLKETLQADSVDSHVMMSDSPLAQLHLIVRPRASADISKFDMSGLEARLAEIVRNWHDDLTDLLIERHGEAEGLRLAKLFGRGLQPAYIESETTLSAADDVDHLSALEKGSALRISLRSEATSSDCEGCFEVKLFHAGSSLPLSDVLPMLENMGLRVMGEKAHRVSTDNGPYFIQDFSVLPASGRVDVDANAQAFVDAFSCMWAGQCENDGFNRLILGAGLTWRQVAMLRSYSKYLLQVGVPFSQSYMESSIAKYPLIARLLVELFEARFDPTTGKESKAQIQAGAAAFESQLKSLADGDEATMALLARAIKARADSRAAQVEAVHATLMALYDRVSSLDEDRILRAFMGVMDATLRTNYYVEYVDGKRKDGGPADYLSFKLDSANVPDLPKPRPYREIWVCGPRVEGVHLRFGPVARGGLRWSDRREDFRTEVLGLVKAQMVKNTVIVPVGSKGGFYCKQLPDINVNRDAWFAEGVECYKRFINGLLDITDNLVKGKVVPPANVVRHDDDDPYLVVAADKGTATFSDIANGISQAHDFWLDDAFASGGSVGYDHKGMGITARGAWESVKRHFRALGHDCQKEDFTCVGIGDMSGDVFGNGMLLSKKIRLLAAFDHRHIFLDPNPDSAESFKERQRLFKLPRSSWADYNTALISKGGGVHPRSAKSIDLTPEVKAALGIDADVKSMTPNDLMSAILKSPVDLLWNGGIGTYVKSSSQSNADVGDRANNGLRVNGRDLRCKIVGEGGNLGFTQLGRVEAAEHGVLINTDFIDNSAGVDTSDHEVNIKILLNGEVQSGRLKLADRNKLLASMTNEVAALVLNDNYRQNQTLTLMERMSATRLGSKLHFIRTLESQGLLDRQIEDLPTDAEMAERKSRGMGLTRPELSVLLAYSKLVAFPRLLASDIPEDKYLSKELLRYFPQPLQEKYAKATESHSLKREIIATAVTNSLINRMGATFLLRMEEDSGRNIGEIARAYTITRETLDARDLWTAIDALDGKVAESVQIDALQVIWELQRSFTRWLLSRAGAIPQISVAVERYHDGFRDIRAGENILPPSQRPDYEEARKAWRAKGLPAQLADQIAALPYLDASPDIIELAREHKSRPVEVAKLYFRLGDALRLPWLRSQIEALEVEGRWHAVARGVLRDELSTQMRKLTAQVLELPGKDPDARVQAWLERDDSNLRFTLSMLAELATQKELDYPTASVAVQRLAQLASRG